VSLVSGPMSSKGMSTTAHLYPHFFRDPPACWSHRYYALHHPNADSYRPPDPILGVQEAFNKDTSETKVNLGVGAYVRPFSPYPTPLSRLHDLRAARYAALGRELIQSRETKMASRSYSSRSKKPKISCTSSARIKSTCLSLYVHVLYRVTPTDMRRWIDHVGVEIQ
jgi:hypothetical protein